MSGIVQFVLMTFVALSMNGAEDIVDEEIVWLHGNNPMVYSISRELTMVLVSCFYGVFLTIGPVVVNCMNNFIFFNRTLSGMNVLMAGMIIFGSGIAGIAIGDFLHPRILGDRKLAITIEMVFLILAITKNKILAKYSVFKCFGVLFPSVMKPAQDMGNNDYFDVCSVGIFFLMMTIYYLIVAIIKNNLFNRKKLTKKH